MRVRSDRFYPLVMLKFFKISLIALAAISILAVCTVAGGLYWASSVPGISFRGPAPAATSEQKALAERLREHVVQLAKSERNVPRNAAGLENAARYIERQLTGFGYGIENQSYEAAGHSVRNITARFGGDSKETPTIVIGAHYDSFPGTPGANDNASGVAVLIELARQLRELRSQSAVRLRLVFFTNEEPPFFHTKLMGSFQYAKMLTENRERVNAMYSLETLGYYSNEPDSQEYAWPMGLVYPKQGDFVAFVAMTASRRLMQESIKAFREKAQIPSEGGAAPSFIEGTDYSDHWSFEQFKYPSIMITDTAEFRDPNYHRRTDTPDKLDYDKLSRVTQGVEAMIRQRIDSLKSPQLR
jgi:Peptidase family M28